MNNILNTLLKEKKYKYKGGLYHNSQIGFAYNSNKIEGSTFTEDQTRFLFETRSIKFSKEELIPKDDVTIMDNHFFLFNYMIDTANETLSESIIKEYHKILFTCTDISREKDFAVGEYKKISNTIGYFIETTEPKNVHSEMKTLLEEYTSKKEIHFNDIVDFHYSFEAIHPFQNGNGRIGRMIMFKECLKNNIVPFIITNDIKRYYTLGLDEYKDSKNRLRETCAMCQDNYASMCGHFNIDISNQERSLPKV